MAGYGLTQRSFPNNLFKITVMSFVLWFSTTAAAQVPPPFSVKWEGGSGMPHPVYWGASCSLEGKLYIFGGIGEDEGSIPYDVKYTQIYDPLTNSWQEGAPMDSGRRLATAAACGGKIYVMGGRNSSGSFDANLEYNPESDTWRYRALMPNPVRGHCAVAVQGKVYVFGGNADLIENAYSDAVWVYDPATDRWEEGRPMPAGFAYGYCGFVEPAGRIYCADGETGNCYAYDPLTDSWDPEASQMKVKVSGSAAVPFGDRLYLFGSSAPGTGGGAASLNQVLDTKTGMWESIAPYPFTWEGYWPSAGRIDGDICVVLAQVGSPSTGYTMSYDPRSDGWSPVPVLPPEFARQGAAVQAVGEKIYIIGGGSGWDYADTVACFDTMTFSITQCGARDLVRRSGAASAVWNGKIIISGGESLSAIPEGVTTMYDPVEDSFTMLAPAPSTLAMSAAAVAGDTFFIFGGGSLDPADPSPSRTVLALDLVSGVWSTRSDLPVPLFAATAQAVEREIYIFGGMDGTTKPDNGVNDEVLIYHSLFDDYSYGAKMPAASYGSGSAIYGKFIIVDSGVRTYYDPDSDTVLAEMDPHLKVYDPDENHWYWASRPSGRWGHGTAVVGNRLFSVGGRGWSMPADRIDIAVLGELPCEIRCFATVPVFGTTSKAADFKSYAEVSWCPRWATFSWDFGDGSAPSSEQSPTHLYARAGYYWWTMTVTAGDAVCSESGKITICSIDCSASAEPASGFAPLDVDFLAAAWLVNCEGPEPSYRWDFGDGNGWNIPNPIHTYTAAGTYEWSVTATIWDMTCTKSGRIQVLQRPKVPGDCDGDGAVSIAELQKAINMFLGTAQPDCGVDCDGDGRVSIGELQKVVTAFLTLESNC